MPKHYVNAFKRTLKRWGWGYKDLDEMQKSQTIIWLQSNIGLTRKQAKQLLQESLNALKKEREKKEAKRKPDSTLDRWIGGDLLK